MKHDFYLRRRRLRDKKPKPLSGARYAKDYKDLYALILAEWNDPIRGPAFQAWWKNVMAFGRYEFCLIIMPIRFTHTVLGDNMPLGVLEEILLSWKLFDGGVDYQVSAAVTSSYSPSP